LDDETMQAVIAREAELHLSRIKDELPLASGIVNLLKIAARSFQLGVVSMAERVEVDYVLEHAAVAGLFTVIISAEDVSACKPDPACYELALSRLNLLEGSPESAVTFAGPGGDFALPGNAVCSFPRNPAGTSLQFCWVLDMVMAPCRGGGGSISSFCWAAGTSMASPAVAGVAALIVGKYGNVGPAEIERRLRQSADDLGKPGNDDFYGRGRVNAFTAIQ